MTIEKGLAMTLPFCHCEEAVATKQSHAPQGHAPRCNCVNWFIYGIIHSGKSGIMTVSLSSATTGSKPQAQ